MQLPRPLACVGSLTYAIHAHPRWRKHVRQALVTLILGRSATTTHTRELGSLCRRLAERISVCPATETNLDRSPGAPREHRPERSAPALIARGQRRRLTWAASSVPPVSAVRLGEVEAEGQCWRARFCPRFGARGQATLDATAAHAAGSLPTALLRAGGGRRSRQRGTRGTAATWSWAPSIDSCIRCRLLE